MPNQNEQKAKKELPPIVRRVQDPPVPNRAHTEMKQKEQLGKKAQEEQQPLAPRKRKKARGSSPFLLS